MASGYARLAEVLGDPSKQNLGDQQGALECYGRTIELLESIPAWDEDAGILIAVGAAYQGRGTIQLALGRTDEAIGSMERGMTLTERAAEIDPGQEELPRRVAYGRANLGRIQEQIGRPRDAIRNYGFYESFARSQIEANPDDLMMRGNLAVALSRIANLQLHWLDEHEQALERYEEALAIAQENADADPTNARWRKSLASSHQSLGGALMELGRIPEAVERFEHAREVAREVVEADPEDQHAQRQHATVHFWLGSAALEGGDAQGAVEHLLRYEALVRALIERSPDYAVVQRDLGVALSRLGEALTEAGRYDEAEAKARAAVEQYEALSASNPEDAPLRTDRYRARFELAIALVAGAEAGLDAERRWRDARRAFVEVRDMAGILLAEDLLTGTDREGAETLDGWIARCEAALAGEE